MFEIIKDKQLALAGEICQQLTLKVLIGGKCNSYRLGGRLKDVVRRLDGSQVDEEHPVREL